MTTTTLTTKRIQAGEYEVKAWGNTYNICLTDNGQGKAIWNMNIVNADGGLETFNSTDTLKDAKHIIANDYYQGRG